METIIIIILAVISIALLIKLLSWLTDIVIKVLIGAACIAVLLLLFEVPIPAEITAQVQAGFTNLSQKLSNIDFVALKEKIVAFLELSRDYING